jgi:hypothetical protein
MALQNAVLTDDACQVANDNSRTQRLKRNSVGLAGVVFMALSAAAPIIAMTGNCRSPSGVATAWALQQACCPSRTGADCRRMTQLERAAAVYGQVLRRRAAASRVLAEIRTAHRRAPTSPADT